MAQEALERQIMDLLLAGEDPVLTRLRVQYAAATVVSRDFTGSGVFVGFAVPPSIPRTQPPSFTVADVAFELVGVANGGSVVLFIRDGVLSTLELYNWTDPWPADPELAKATYLRAVYTTNTSANLEPVPTRDLVEFRRRLNEVT